MYHGMGLKNNKFLDKQTTGYTWYSFVLGSFREHFILQEKYNAIWCGI
jgi:hypothetical protein